MPAQALVARPGRLVALATVVVVACAVLLSRPVHERLLLLMQATEQVIRQRPAEGMVAFTALAAISAMLAFVSSAVLIPAPVYAWGPAMSCALLWLGWFAGGLFAYAVGRWLGRPVVRLLVRERTLARYERWVQPGASTLVPMLLVQLAIPSDVAGYLFGLVRCPFRVFVVALAIAEIPYAVGAAYLGESFVQGRLLPLLAIGGAGVLLSVWALRAARAHGRAAGPPPDDALAPGAAEAPAPLEARLP